MNLINNKELKVSCNTAKIKGKIKIIYEDKSEVCHKGKEEVNLNITNKINVKGKIKADLIRSNDVYVKGKADIKIIECKELNVSGAIKSEYISGDDIKIIFSGQSNITEIITNKLFIKKAEINDSKCIEELVSKYLKVNLELEKNTKINIERIQADEVYLEECTVNLLVCNKATIDKKSVIKNVKCNEISYV